MFCCLPQLENGQPVGGVSPGPSVQCHPLHQGIRKQAFLGVAPHQQILVRAGATLLQTANQCVVQNGGLRDMAFVVLGIGQKQLEGSAKPRIFIQQLYVPLVDAGQVSQVRP